MSLTLKLPRISCFFDKKIILPQQPGNNIILRLFSKSDLAKCIDGHDSENIFNERGDLRLARVRSKIRKKNMEVKNIKKI